MQSIQNWVPWLFAGIALLLGFAAEQTIERFQRDSMLSHERDHVIGELSQIRTGLEGVINANLLMVQSLAAVIAAEPDIDQARFSFYARRLFGDHSPLRNIAGAPDMVVSLMHPVQGNEAAIGLDYRTHPTQREAAMTVIERGDTVIAGPLTLVQGGVGIIARHPVYVDIETSDGGRRLWGLVSAVLDVDRLYEIAGLHRTTRPAGLTAALRGRDGKGMRGDVFFGDPAVFDTEPVAVDISLPGGGSWRLAAIPAGGWESHVHAGEIRATRLIGLLLTVLIAALTYWVTRSTMQLRATSGELRESQALFAGFMENLPAGAYIKNARTNQLVFENRWLQTNLSTKPTCCGVDSRDDIPALREGPNKAEQQPCCADSTLQHCDTLTFLLDDGPAAPLVGGIVMDVSERVAAQRDLAANRARLRTLIDTIPDLIWLKDPDGVYLACNHEFERFFGASEAEIIGKRDADFVDAELAEFFRKHDLMAMAAGGPSKNEEEVEYASDGHKALLETVKTPVVDSNGELTGVLGIARDITARRSAEQALRSNTQRLEDAEKLAHIGNWEYHVAKARLSWSDEAYRIFGIEPQARTIDAEWLLSRIDPGDRERYRTRMASLLDSAPGFEPTPFRYRIARVDGTTSVLVERARVEFTEDGKPLRIFGTAQDVTEREKLHREVEERLAELTRWQDVILGREERILELKREVNQLLHEHGQPIRYPSQGESH